MSCNPITQSASRKKKGKSSSDDPTEGDGRRWATGAKFSFLNSRLTHWHDARDLGEMSTFYSRLTLLFIRHFTWERALDLDGNGPAEEPSEENLDAVLDVTGLDAEEIARRNSVYIELRNRLQRWYRYHGTKTLKSKNDDPLMKILKAFKSEDKAPRRMQTLQFYSKLYYDTRIKPIVDAEWPGVVARAGSKGAPVPKRIKHQNNVIARMFAAETSEFQTALKAQRDAEYDEELAAWRASSLDTVDVPQTPEEFAQALSETGSWLPGLAAALAKRLGLNVSILLTGPMGEQGGRIDVKGVHEGESIGLAPKHWPHYDTHAYEALLKSLIGFAKACFTTQQCRDRALPGTIPLDEDSHASSSPSSPAVSLPVSTESSRGAASTSPPSGALGGSSVASLNDSPAPSAITRLPLSASLRGNGGGRASTIPTMPSPLRMVSRLSSSSTRVSVPPDAIIPAAKDTTEPTAVPMTGTLATHVSAPPSPEESASSTSSSTGQLPATPSSPPPTMVSSSAPPPPPPSTTPSSTIERAMIPSQPPVRPESLTPETEVSSLPPSSPPLASASVAAAASAITATASRRPPRLSSMPMLTSVSAGPLATISPGPSFSLPSASPASISAGPLTSGSVGPRPGAFSKVDITNCPSTIISIVDYLEGHKWGVVWEHCVATYVEIERYAQFQAQGVLLSPTEGRPPEVADWMKRHRKLVDFPIKDVDKFAVAWCKWWSNNKPASEGIQPELRVNLDWGVLNVTGPNGLLLFMLTLAWWGSVAADDQARQGKWLVAVGDVRLALDRVLVAAAASDTGGANNIDIDVDLGVQETTSRKRRRGATVSKASTSIVKRLRASKK